MQEYHLRRRLTQFSFSPFWGRWRPARKRFIGAKRPDETPKTFVSQIMARF
jgi:hypothetical protein